MIQNKHRNNNSIRVLVQGRVFKQRAGDKSGAKVVVHKNQQAVFGNAWLLGLAGPIRQPCDEHITSHSAAEKSRVAPTRPDGPPFRRRLVLPSQERKQCLSAHRANLQGRTAPPFCHCPRPSHARVEPHHEYDEAPHLQRIPLTPRPASGQQETVRSRAAAARTTPAIPIGTKGPRPESSFRHIAVKRPFHTISRPASDGQAAVKIQPDPAGAEVVAVACIVPGPMRRCRRDPHCWIHVRNWTQRISPSVTTRPRPGFGHPPRGAPRQDRLFLRLGRHPEAQALVQSASFRVRPEFGDRAGAVALGEFIPTWCGYIHHHHLSTFPCGLSR